MNKALRTLFVVVIVLLVYTGPSLAYERIVVLYAAASPVLKALGLQKEIVGVTRTDHTFKGVASVGSHLRPNIEILKALRPDLIVAGSKRAFPREMEKRLDTRVFYFDPRTLEDILSRIESLGRLLGRERQASRLVSQLKAKLSEVKPLKQRPTVIYEISARPLKVAGSRSIITSIVEHAGGANLIKVKRKHVLISPEKVIKLTPDFYIYQVGPMNKNPSPPDRRSYFKRLSAKVARVDEYKFARPGINAFQAVVDLNRIFMEVQK